MLNRFKTSNKETLIYDGNDIKFDNVNDSILYIFYDENGEIVNDCYSPELLLYIIQAEENHEYLQEEIEYALHTSLFTFEKEKDIVKSVNYKRGDSNYNFQTLTFEVTSPNRGNVKYVKGLMYMNPSQRAYMAMIQIYLVASSVVIFIAMITSIIYARYALKPVEYTIEKHQSFIADVSHELKTPLAIARSRLENILCKSDQSVMDVSEDIAISLEQINRLNKLTEDLLKLANSDKNQYYYDFKQVDLKKLIENTASVFKEMAEISNKKFQMELDEVVAFVDEAKFSEVVVILLDNAIKYTNENEEIFVKLFKQKDEFFFQVSDTGIGIDDENKEEIFSRFYREKKVKDSAIQGNGLGLPIALEIVKSHKGKIEVTNNTPKGTIFTISMSLKEK